MDPLKLRNILGTGMSAKMWEVTVDHARTCVLEKRVYLYCPPGSQPKTGVVFNVVGQVMGLLSGCQKLVIVSIPNAPPSPTIPRRKTLIRMPSYASPVSLHPQQHTTLISLTLSTHTHTDSRSPLPIFLCISLRRRRIVLLSSPIALSSALTKRQPLFRNQKSQLKMKRQKKENFSVQIRHSCAIEDFCAYNDNLTPDQRQLIERTPFGVLLDIPKTNINGKLLECLIDKWDEGESGFWLKDKLVRFTQHDVACILGLRVGGTRVRVFEDYGSSQLDTILRSFFPNQTLTRRFISQLISPCASNDDFVRMYIALAFTFFLFPLPSRGIHRHFFRLLDKLDDLSEYGWGEAVYVFLVDGIRDAVRARKMKTNYSEIRIRGCALLLQVWALEHTSMVEATSSSCSWPRIRKWTSKNLSSRHVHSIIQFTESDKEAVPILAPTEEELKESVIQESLRMIDCYFPSTQPPSVHGHNQSPNEVVVGGIYSVNLEERPRSSQGGLATGMGMGHITAIMLTQSRQMLMCQANQGELT
ncbi:hypothetical protein L1049_027800 [Liquidambar formosana]|uniref:Aminotransferase-like plant mobile domain-containing protein n=1 Tax=Liquidambar formosana TaxID=63359 RepID=A0AAP0RJ92_LIQFO